MNIDNLVAHYHQISKIVAENDDFLKQDIHVFKKNHAIDEPDILKLAFEKLVDDNRKMHIGVVGRVKAGKSSLLNALIFDGKQVLPKAATPMTAALTMISYREELSAEVAFFSTEDINNFHDNYQRYENRLRELTNKYTRELKQAKKFVKEDETFRKQVEGRVQRELKNDTVLVAAYDQYNSIKKSGIDPLKLGLSKTLNAPTIEALKSILETYVGTNGSYTPFTKSVDIFLPENALKDICIIDTPGLNDPVLSREARTCELLKFCDVVFIVSSAGQFLTVDDLNLMGRITHKEGVHELFVVASQIDNQLFGSERQPILKKALNNITRVLNEQMVKTLTIFKAENPEIGDTFDSLCNQEHTKLLYSSGMCHSLNSRFDHRDEWDDGAKKVWDNLQEFYPDFFSEQDKTLSKANLGLLANTAALQTALADVRSQKERIIEERRQNLITAKTTALNDYISELLTYAKQQLTIIEGSNLDSLNKQSQEFERIKDNLSGRLNFAYGDLVDSLEIDLRHELKNILTTAYKTTNHQMKEATSTYSGSYTVEKSGVGNWFARKIWGGGTETRYYTEERVITAQVYGAISHFINNIDDDISDKTSEINSKWRKQLFKKLVDEYRKIVGDIEADENLIFRTLKGITDKVYLIQFSNITSIPKELTSKGTLTGTSATDYLETASNYLNNQEEQFSNQVKDYIKRLKIGLKIDIAEEFCKDYNSRLEDLRRQIDNQHESIDRLKRLINQLQKESQV